MSEDVFDAALAAVELSPAYAAGDGAHAPSFAGNEAQVVSNSEFMALLLAGAQGHSWVSAFPGKPDIDPGKWRGRPFVPNDINNALVDGWGELNSYFCVAELKDVDGGRARQKMYFLRLRALVVDDAIDGSVIGTPTWVLETSPGNVQVGILVDPFDPDAADAMLVDAVMAELHKRKLLGDSSGNSSTRYVRLPNGTNGKPRESGPFRTQMLVWHPGQVLSLADACAVFGIDLDEIRKGVKPASTDDAIIFGGVGQDRLMAEAIENIVTGADYHESLNRLAASAAASGMRPGSQVNLLRGLMSAVQAPRDARWQSRYDDIPRAVDTASRKFQIEPLAAPGEPEEKKPLIVRYGDLSAELEEVDWLIKDWLEAGALSMLYGSPGTGKSFAAIDQACCIATGTPWRGFKVKQGPVIIIVGEGERGIKRRMRAWEKKTGIRLKDAPIFFTVRPVQILNPDSAMELVADIDAVMARLDGLHPVLISIDTVARNFGPGDENSTQDASAFIGVIDRWVRNRYHCHVSLVHHTGKDASAGARGSSVFRASVDQMFSLAKKSYGEVIELKSTKMKDAEEPRPLCFRLERIVLGEDKAGEPITSAYLESVANEWDEEIVKSAKGPITLGQVLRLRDGEYMTGRTSMVSALEISERQARTVLERLEERGLIEKATQQKVRRRLTQKAMLLLSGAGDLLRDGQAQTDAGGDEVGVDDDQH